MAEDSNPQPGHSEYDALVAWTREWGQLLRGARQVAGLSLAGVSERTGLSRGYLSKLESSQEGARNPSRATLAALARALPSFRALANQLEPGGAASVVSVARAEERPRASAAPAAPSASLSLPSQTATDVVPIQLGWREFEALVAFIALERSATVAPLSARLIARAAGRPLEPVRQILNELARKGALQARPPARSDADPTYARGPALEAELGLSHIGDALILAAALFTQASARRPTHPRDSDGGESDDL